MEKIIIFFMLLQLILACKKDDTCTACLNDSSCTFFVLRGGGVTCEVAKKKIKFVIFKATKVQNCVTASEIIAAKFLKTSSTTEIFPWIEVPSAFNASNKEGTKSTVDNPTSVLHNIPANFPIVEDNIPIQETNYRGEHATSSEKNMGTENPEGIHDLEINARVSDMNKQTTKLSTTEEPSISFDSTIPTTVTKRAVYTNTPFHKLYTTTAPYDDVHSIVEVDSSVLRDIDFVDVEPNKDEFTHTTKQYDVRGSSFLPTEDTFIESTTVTSVDKQTASGAGFIVHDTEHDVHINTHTHFPDEEKTATTTSHIENVSNRKKKGTVPSILNEPTTNKYDSYPVGATIVIEVEADRDYFPLASSIQSENVERDMLTSMLFVLFVFLVPLAGLVAAYYRSRNTLPTERVEVVELQDFSV